MKRAGRGGGAPSQTGNFSHIQAPPPRPARFAFLDFPGRIRTSNEGTKIPSVTDYTTGKGASLYGRAAYRWRSTRSISGLSGFGFADFASHSRHCASTFAASASRPSFL